MGNTYICKVLVGKSERKIPFVVHRRKWEENIKVDFKETGYEGRAQ
jgi:hypothetical protein